MTKRSPSYRFECSLCGSCCTGAQEVFLSDDDMQRLVVHLGLQCIQDLYAKALVEDALWQDGIMRPRLRFKPKRSGGRVRAKQCPFLHNNIASGGEYQGLCALHSSAAKPLVCLLAPLSREVVQDNVCKISENWTLVEPARNCPGMGRGPEQVLEAPAHLVERLEAEEAYILKLFMKRSSPSAASF